MNNNILPRALCFFAIVVLVACGNKANKIGETIRGDRIAVIEQTKRQDFDRAALNQKPSLSREIVNLSWPQVGYDSEHSMPHVQAAAHPQIVWKADIGEGASSDFKLLARPVLSRDKIYTMDAQGLVRAFNVDTGEKNWERDTTPKDSDGPAIGGGLAVDGDTVYATTGGGFVYALQAKTGGVKWKKALLKPLRAAPTVADNRVYVVSVDNELSALNATTGEVLWRHTGIAESATLMGTSSPAVQGDSVIVAYSSGEIFSLRVQNGRVSWSYSLAAPAQLGALPAIADIRGLPVNDRGRIYAISHSGRFAALDQRTGGRVWEADIGGIDTPVISGDAIFVYGADGRLISLARDDGRILWSSSLPKYVDQNDKNSDPIIWTGPLLVSGKLWMVNSQGKMESFSPEDGTSLGGVDLNEPIFLSPIVVNRTFYVVADDGTLIALR